MADLDIVDVPPRLKEGIRLVEKGAVAEARALFDGYLEIQPDSTLARSFAGMLRAEQGETQEGLAMCQDAAERDHREALIFLNLAKAHMANGDRFQCVRALQRGMRLKSPHRGQLMTFHKTIGIRRKPILSFLDRNHPINDFLGRMTWVLSGRR